MEYTIEGDAIIPADPTTIGKRVLYRDELKDGHVILATSKARTVAKQLAGHWDDTFGSVRPVITLKGIDGTETDPGSATFVWPAGLVVHHAASTTDLRERYWRVQIPVQDCPDAYFKAGVVMVGEVVMFGRKTDWQRTDEHRQNSTTTTDGRGTTRTRALGPPRRRWSMAWQDAINHRFIREWPRASTVAHDYYGETSHLAVRIGDDVAYLLTALQAELKSGEIPCVAIESMPIVDDDTITDRTRFLYGRLSSSVRLDYINGEIGQVNGDGEIVRIPSITIDEIV